MKTIELAPDTDLTQLVGVRVSVQNLDGDGLRYPRPPAVGVFTALRQAEGPDWIWADYYYVTGLFVREGETRARRWDLRWRLARITVLDPPVAV